MCRKKLLKPIGRLCKKARKEHDCSVEQMASYLNVTKNAVYRFERGHYDTATFLLVYVYYFDMFISYPEVFKLIMEASNDE